MKIITESLNFNTCGNCDIIDITNQVQECIKKAAIQNGIVNIFIPGATGAITTMEYEPGLIKDTKEMFRKLVPEKNNYSHDKSHTKGNAPSHLQATLLGPSLTVPFENSKLQIGIWQQIVFIDFDNRPRKRELIIKIMGD